MIAALVATVALISPMGGGYFLPQTETERRAESLVIGFTPAEIAEYEREEGGARWAGAEASTTRRRPARHARKAALAPIPDTNPYALAYAAAVAYWGAPPCEPTITWGNPDETRWHWEAGPSQAGVETHALGVQAWTDIGACHVYFNEQEWTSWQWDLDNYQWFCDVMVHEIGHLLGHEDVGQTNPAGITYPLIEPGSPNYNAVWQCRNTSYWDDGTKITLTHGIERDSYR